MPQVLPCIYCRREIQKEREKYVAIPSRPSVFAHLTCYEKNNPTSAELTRG
jgi:hypothetical protein